MTRKILLADDSLTIQKVVELTFMEGDYEVIAVGNGDDALRRLGEMQPDVVIADVHMPGADGFEICKVTKDKYPGVPVLLLVGTFEPFEEDSARESGADAHLKKPFDSQELLRLVEDLSSSQEEEETPLPEISETGPGEMGTPTAAGFNGDDFKVEFDVDESLEHDEAVVVAPLDDRVGADVGSAFGQDNEGEDSMTTAPAGLSDEDIDRIARRVVELIGDQTVREISWDVVPDLAEILIKDRIRELESQAD